MLTTDTAVFHAPAATCFRVAADVERWADALPHYRWVRFRRKDGFGTGLVEMAARRDFGPLPYPVWWVSEMTVDPDRPAVYYRHVAGITTGMDVVWSFEPLPDGTTRVEIVHEWAGGPAWPVPAAIRRWIANAIIGPIFIHHVATRTLRGIGRRAEAMQGAERIEPDAGRASST